MTASKLFVLNNWLNSAHSAAVINRENDGYVALCPELDIASQGDTVDEARANLKEALELFFETVSPEEIKARVHVDV